MFANPFREGAEEFFVVDVDHHLTYVHRTPEGDGWVQVRFDLGPSGQPAVDLVAAVHPDGSVWLLASYGSAEGQLAAFRLEADSTWRRLGFDGDNFGWNHLSVHYLPDRPATPCVVGVNAQRDQLQALTPVVGSVGDDPVFWETAVDTALASPLPEIFHAGMQLDGTLRVYALEGDAIMRRTYSGAWENDVRIDASGAKELSGLWNAPEGLGCVFVRSDGMPGAYSPVDAGNGVTWWLDVAELLTQTSVWQDEHGMLHIFGIGTSADRPAMGVIHQRGWARVALPDSNVVKPLFVTAPRLGADTVVVFPLVARVGGFHLDTAPDPYPSQLLTPDDVGGPYRVVSQDTTTSWWNDEAVTLSGTGGTIQLQRRYVGDVTLLDGFGAPMPAWPLQLSATSTVDVDVNGRMLRLGPTATAHVLTDGVGKVTIRAAARGLTVPTIQVTAKGIGEGASVELAAGVQGFLSGASILAAHPDKLTAQQLLDAKVSSGWLVPIWHQPNPVIDPDFIIESLQLVYALARGNPPPGDEGQRSGLVVHWDGADQVAHRELRPGETSRDALGAGASFDATPYRGDIARGIRDGLLQVDGFAISLNGRATFTCEAANQVSFTVDYDLLSGADASMAVEAIFQFLHAGVDRLVEWLTYDFPFEAVWTTAEALSAGVGELPSALTAAASHYQELLKGDWFSAHADLVTEAFATLREQVNGLRIDSLQGIKPPAVALPLPIYQPETLLTPQTTWLHDVIVGQGPRPLAAAASEPDPLWDPIWQLFVGSPPGEAFQAALVEARTSLLALWDLDDARAVPGTQIQALVDIAEALVPRLLPLADLMIGPLCTALGDIATRLDDLASTPVLGTELLDAYVWFQRQAGVPAGQEKPLTFGRLGAWYSAFPMAGAYDTLLGVAPFPDAAFPDLPPTPWSSSVRGSSEAPEGAHDFQVLRGLAEMTYALTDGYLDVNQPNRWLSSSIASCEVVGLTLAGYPGLRGIASDSDAEGAIAWGQWALWSVLSALDVYLSTEHDDHPLVTTYAGSQGSGFLCMVGVGQLALAGAAYAGSARSGLDQEWLTASLGAALPSFTAPLRVLQDLPPDQGRPATGLGLKTLLDQAVHTYSGSTQVALRLGDPRSS